MVELLGGTDVEITAVGPAGRRRASRKHDLDCVVIDAACQIYLRCELIGRDPEASRLRELPDRHLYRQRTARAEETELTAAPARSVVRFTDVESESLLEETTLFLHRAEAIFPNASGSLIERSGRVMSTLVGQEGTGGG